MSAGFSAVRIAEAWPSGVPRPCIEVAREIDSTQDALRARGAAATGCLLIAERQRAGRGQRGRTWLSPPAAGLYLSLGWRLPRPLAGLGGLSLALGVGLAETLQARGFAGIAVKWPNDLVVGQAKLAGLLVELGVGETGGVVVGLGLNLRLPPDAGERLQRPVTDLSRLGALPPAEELVAGVAASLVATLQAFAQEGFAPWLPRWRAVDALAGRRLQVQRTGLPPLQGEGAGVDADGALLLRSGAQLTRLHSGQASVLAA